MKLLDSCQKDHEIEKPKIHQISSETKYLPKCPQEFDREFGVKWLAHFHSHFKIAAAV